jgi:hypothetical protein
VQKRIAIWNPTRGIWENPDGTVDLLSEHSEPFSEIWPSSGMTRNGRAFERPTPAPLMDDSASSSSPALLGTPRNSDGSKSPLVERENARGRLEDQIALLKTPNANLAINGGSQHPDRRKQGGHGPTLADEVEHLLPTPTGTNANGNRENARGEPLLPGIALLLPTPTAFGNAPQGPEDPEAWEAWKQARAAKGHATGQGVLGTAIRALTLPTPTAADAKGSGGNDPKDRTLTDVVVRSSLGATTNPRFADGKPSSAETRPPRQRRAPSEDRDSRPSSSNG